MAQTLGLFFFWGGCMRTHTPPWPLIFQCCTAAACSADCTGRGRGGGGPESLLFNTHYWRMMRSISHDCGRSIIS